VTYFTPRFLRELRSLVMPQLLPPVMFSEFSNCGFTVAMHIRRGDITKGKHSKRSTPDEFYFDIIHAIREIRSDAIIHAWSDSSDPREFISYLGLGIQMHLGGDILDAMAHFSTARLFVMAISSFSFIPALLNPNCVVYQPSTGVGGIWVDSLQHWIRSNASVIPDRFKKCVIRRDDCPCHRNSHINTVEGYAMPSHEMLLL